MTTYAHEATETMIGNVGEVRLVPCDFTELLGTLSSSETLTGTPTITLVSGSGITLSAKLVSKAALAGGSSAW